MTLTRLPAATRPLRNGVLIAVLAALVSGCMTQNAYTGEKQVSKTTTGAGIGALAGAAVGARAKKPSTADNPSRADRRSSLDIEVPFDRLSPTGTTIANTLKPDQELKRNFTRHRPAPLPATLAERNHQAPLTVTRPNARSASVWASWPSR